MFNWKEFEKSQELLSQFGGASYRAEWGQHHIVVRPVNLLDWIVFLKEDLGYFTVSEMTASDHGPEADPRFEVVYHLLNMGTHQRVNLHLLVNDQEVIPSIKEFFPHADWMEREQAEMFHLKFNVKQAPLILPQEQKNYPLRKDAKLKKWPVDEAIPLPKLRFNPNKSEAPYPEESYQWKKFDSFSPLTKGMFDWMVCFDPNHVVDSKINIGLHHQGLEKLLEDRDLIQITELVDKINLNAAPHYSIAWAKTIEEMFRIKLPERAQAIRIVMLELARIADHLTILAEICFHARQDEYKLLINCREKVYEIFEKSCGHRQGLGVAKLGGVKEDLPYGWIVEYQVAADIITKNLKLIHRALIGRQSFRSLMEGSPVNAQSVLQWGVSGPVMRAAGLNFDLRKSQPFYFYQDIDFDVPVGIHGASYDRYLIRYEEIMQSFRIVTQVMDNLPLGDFVNEEFSGNYLEIMKVLQSKQLDYNWHYSSLEAPQGEAGFLLHLGAEFKPQRIKIRTPSFSEAQALGVFVSGLTEAQLAPALASLALNPWEMDR